MADHVLEYLNIRPDRNRVLAQHLTEIDIFDEDHVWSGRLGIENGIIYGLAADSVPITVHYRTWLHCGTLRRLVLDSYRTEDMLQILDLMATNSLLQQIKVPAQENTIFRQIELIRQKCYNRTLPLELIVAHQQETIFSRLIINAEEDSMPLDAGPNRENIPSEISIDVVQWYRDYFLEQLQEGGAEILNAASQRQQAPSIDIIQWHLDHLSEQLQDSGAEILDAASQKSPGALSNFTLDTTLLSEQGLANIQNILQRSNLEHLFIKCVPLMPSLETSIVRILQSIQWSTIKSLVLSGNNTNYWLQVWSRECSLNAQVGAWLAPTTSGPNLSYLKVLAKPHSKEVLSHSSALAIHCLVYSWHLVELHLENMLLGNK